MAGRKRKSHDIETEEKEYMEIIKKSERREGKFCSCCGVVMLVVVVVMVVVASAQITWPETKQIAHTKGQRKS